MPNVAPRGGLSHPVFFYWKQLRDPNGIERSRLLDVWNGCRVQSKIRPPLPLYMYIFFINCFAQISFLQMATPKKSPAKRTGKKGSRASKAGLVFPVGRIASMLRKGQYARRISSSAPVYTAAVLEYLTAELLELSAKTMGKKGRLTPRAITLAVRNDDGLGALLKDVTFTHGGVVPTTVHSAKKVKKSGKKASQTA